MKAAKRGIEILVLSDVHLGTYGCRAKELLHYLKSIRPKVVVLNGDIIDIWQFSKNYWPKSHMKVVKHLVSWISKGVRIYYIPGNHDEMLRRFSGLNMGAFSIQNKVVLTLEGGDKAWFFHGDVFDVTMQHSKWLAKLGAVGYDTLILINTFFNFFSEKVFNKGKFSLSKRIKNSVKSAVKFINNFEQTAADIGISNRFRYVVCGHIHQPEIKLIENKEGQIIYLNSGDWVENLTSLEYENNQWKIYQFQEKLPEPDEEDEEPDTMNDQQIFNNLLEEFNIMRQ
jgi:UDP-2,3-diacylglucosamine pyrophosphatase LpxH